MASALALKKRPSTGPRLSTSFTVCAAAFTSLTAVVIAARAVRGSIILALRQVVVLCLASFSCSYSLFYIFVITKPLVFSINLDVNSPTFMSLYP